MSDSLVPTSKFDRINHWISGYLAYIPHGSATLKLVILTPAILLMAGLFDIPAVKTLVVLIYLIYGVLDYVEGSGQRESKPASRLGYIYDRIADYPLLMGLGVLTYDKINIWILLLKLLVDGAYIATQILKTDHSHFRMRSGINYVTMLVMLLLAMETSANTITPDLVNMVLVISVALSLTLIGHAVGLLGKHLIADALSLGNLLCGLGAIYMAQLGRLDLSLVFICLGAAFDGLDGAAARKFGSTRWGVYSDDIADAITYGIAPGVIIMLHLNQFDAMLHGVSMDGVIIGSLYMVFTITRLIYFTLNKQGADPGYFFGAPSVFGGIFVITSLIMLGSHYALIGLMVGVACVLMVSFDSRYRHLGRLIGDRKAVRWAGLVLVLLVVLLGFMNLTNIAIGLIFVACLVYGFIPTVLNVREMLRRRVETK